MLRLGSRDQRSGLAPASQIDFLVARRRRGRAPGRRVRRRLRAPVVAGASVDQSVRREAMGVLQHLCHAVPARRPRCRPLWHQTREASTSWHSRTAARDILRVRATRRGRRTPSRDQRSAQTAGSSCTTPARSRSATPSAKQLLTMSMRTRCSCSAVISNGGLQIARTSVEHGALAESPCSGVRGDQRRAAARRRPGLSLVETLLLRGRPDHSMDM
jgi:hypothetical protein